MTIALTVVLNVAAVAALLPLLTATMRLPYYLPSTPRADRVDGRTKHRVQARPHTAHSGQRSPDRRNMPEPSYSQ
jgi:hypothetical protein